MQASIAALRGRNNDNDSKVPNCPLGTYASRFLCPGQLTMGTIQSLANETAFSKISQISKVVVTVVHCQSEEIQGEVLIGHVRTRCWEPNTDAIHVISDAFTRLIAIGVL